MAHVWSVSNDRWGSKVMGNLSFEFLMDRQNLTL